MGSSKSGRVENNIRIRAVADQKFQKQRLNMERQYNEDWVFRLKPTPQFHTPSNEYTLIFRKRILTEDLLRILRRVEAELSDALIK